MGCAFMHTPQDERWGVHECTAMGLSIRDACVTNAQPHRMRHECSTPSLTPQDERWGWAFVTHASGWAMHTPSLILRMHTPSLMRPVTHVCVSRDSFTCTRDSFTCVTWLIHVCDIHMRDMPYWYVWHDSFIWVTVTHLYMWRDLFICVTWLIHMCDMTHSYVRHDSFICVTWLIHMCDMPHWYVWNN